MADSLNPQFVASISVAVKGIPLLFVILGLVEYVKSTGVSGRPLLFWSLGIGTLIGSLYMLASTRPPAIGDPWSLYVYFFELVFYGLTLGLVASGIFDLGKGLLTRILGQIVGKVIGLDEPTSAPNEAK